MNRKMKHDDTRTLIHVCCGPCVQYPVSVLMKENIAFDGFFYNPNIHPAIEHQRRLFHTQAYFDSCGHKLLIDKEYGEATWLSFPWQERGISRCHYCYQMRLDAAAKKAKEFGYTHFTSTLLVSIYQDQELMRDIAQRAAKRYGVLFLDRDFANGFREGQKMAQAADLYRQKYCGCIFSLETSDYKEKIYQYFSETYGAT